MTEPAIPAPAPSGPESNRRHGDPSLGGPPFPHRLTPRGDHPMTTTYGIYAPALYGRHHDSHADARAARLGRSLLRWTVYSRSDHGSVYAVVCVSRHWTRRAAIQAAARLTEETTR